MPTPSGAETIGERLTRLRGELARVRSAIDRTERNGASFSMGGVSVSAIAYERLIGRADKLERDIMRLEARLEARLSGGVDRSSVALTKTLSS